MAPDRRQESQSPEATLASKHGFYEREELECVAGKQPKLQRWHAARQLYRSNSGDSFPATCQMSSAQLAEVLKDLMACTVQMR